MGSKESGTMTEEDMSIGAGGWQNTDWPGGNVCQRVVR